VPVTLPGTGINLSCTRHQKDARTKTCSPGQYFTAAWFSRVKAMLLVSIHTTQDARRKVTVNNKWRTHILSDEALSLVTDGNAHN